MTLTSQSRLIELSYYDPGAEVRLTAYADTLVLNERRGEKTMTAIRFGGYPEMVNAMAAAIHGGAAIDAAIRDESIRFQRIRKGYTKQLAHDGVYATATMMANDEAQETESPDDSENDDEEKTEQPRTCYIFCLAGDRERLFEELDRKTAAPLIPAFREQILDALIADKSLRPMKVYALKSSMDAWALTLMPDDRNVVEALERGLKDGSIQIPKSGSDSSDGFEQVGTVTQYLNTFGVTVANRIRNQFEALFDPASQPLSDEVLAVNEYIRSAAGYPLYDAQLAVAESVRRKLRKDKVAIIRAECGSGKTKIGATALGALYSRKKTFNVVMCPSHITKKWVREIGETLPDTYGMIVKSPAEIDRLYGMYASGDKSVYAIMSKEKALDGYMRYPAVIWNRRRKDFLCPDCLEPVQMEISDDSTKYLVNADQFFFLKERIVVKHCGQQQIYRVYCRDNEHTARVLSRELVKETLNRETNQYEKLANISFDKESGLFSYDNLAYDSDVDAAAYCRRAEELFELYQVCANRKQIETICLNYIRGLEATKMSVNGHLYFVPRHSMEKVDIFEDFMEALSSLNRTKVRLMANSIYIIDDLKQRDKMTEEFYAAVKKEIAEYHYVRTTSSRAAAKAGSMIPIRSVSLSSGGMIRKSFLPAGTWTGFLLP